MTDLVTAALDWVHLQKGRSPAYDQMTLRQIAILGLIAANGPIDFGDLTKLLGLTKPVATRAIHALGLLGLVRQSIDPNDRRRRIVAITRKGEALRESLRLAATPPHP